MISMNKRFQRSKLIGSAEISSRRWDKNGAIEGSCPALANQQTRSQAATSKPKVPGLQPFEIDAVLMRCAFLRMWSWLSSTALCVYIKTLYCSFKTENPGASLFNRSIVRLRHNKKRGSGTSGRKSDTEYAFETISMFEIWLDTLA
jgi:hypothetical protein